MGCSLDRIPAQSQQLHTSAPFVSQTIKTTLPKSPVTFRCRLPISSRKGITTVHPRDAAMVSTKTTRCIANGSYPSGVRYISLENRWHQTRSQCVLDLISTSEKSCRSLYLRWKIFKMSISRPSVELIDEDITYRPPCILMIGFPVLVIWTSSRNPLR